MRYSVREAIFPDDAEGVLRLWNQAFPTASDRGHKLAWFYRRPLLAPPICKLLIADSGAMPVGVASIGFREFQAGSSRHLGGLLVDMAVEPAHRAAGPALALQRALSASGKESCAFLYGFPNAKATPIFLRLGYRKVGDVCRLVRVLRTSPYVIERVPSLFTGAATAGLDRIDEWIWGRRSRYNGGLEISWASAPNENISKVWEASLPTNAMVGVRDAAYVAWRFGSYSKDRVMFASLVSTNDGPLAWFACQPSCGELVIRDYWTTLGARGVNDTMLQVLCASAYQAGFRSISVEIVAAQDALEAWQAAGFRKRAQRPVFAHLNSALPSLLAGSLYFTNADEDE